MTEKESKLYQDRMQKLEFLKARGINPYPAESRRTHDIASAVNNFDGLRQSEEKIVLTGRVRALRGHGALVFGNLEDASGRIQLILKEDAIGKKQLEVFKNGVDIGDFLQCEGTVFETNRGEKSLLVSDYKILAKSLRALPDKWHGLTDTETRLRKRYLDMISNPENRELFRAKSLFWQVIRNFMLKQNFLEVETPVLESVPGGAEAEPFITHHNALDQDFYLRISLELPLKRLIVGGFEKVFEIGRIFRNEGISAEHLQDYTQLEFYWAYADYNDLQKLLPELYRETAKSVLGTTKVKNGGREIDWANEFKKYDYYDLFKEHTGIDLVSASDEDLRKKAESLKLDFEKNTGRGRLIDLIYKKNVRPNLIEPGFLLDPPVEIEPLAKRSAKDPNRVERLQVMAWGTELGKGFSELNDPIDQRQRFEGQMKLREAGDTEAQRLDEDFVEALEYGMPPTAGFGLSERVFAMLMDKPIRETVIFPPMKEKE